ncbi:triphosphoribosyl-dephospho-CoA synthase CitG [Clostridium fallax]|uniref:triphosphoribosyl-dephospho-CoA synthase n=1 Tax=Clostridium fallax TaxID=1533 RepID=A0A1M4TTJ0_9CLOT|nr:triphosphoribosyl-dephospho-CoA synthase CitG [Clostridium fallax]SHE47715.1 triphosphoribosyl-dephospho-CoA synthase [Clostridium fallax]SQB22406.1 triphosphoribosyl-dephospho-CoA synthase [Clostridium fallax]
MKNILKIDDRVFNLVEFAVKAMLYEVSSYPSPGLVSPVSNGAHKDMDYYTFLKSTASLIKPMVICANEGFKAKNENELFLQIRNCGKEAEEYMMIRTKGVNTHRGMLFLMGITISAVAFSMKNNLGFQNISTVIKNMCDGIVEKELKNSNLCGELTHGETLYKKYGFKGIRGEVENGLSIIFNYSLPFYEGLKNNSNDNLEENQLLIKTLIKIMCKCDDSTIIYRHDFKKLDYVKKKANNILDELNESNTFKERIEELNKEFIRENISPGGSADLLAITIFLYDIKNKFFK